MYKKPIEEKIREVFGFTGESKALLLYTYIQLDGYRYLIERKKNLLVSLKNS